MRRSYLGLRTIAITALLTAVVMLVLLYAPSPFIVTKPGIAVPTNGYVKLDEQSNEATADELHMGMSTESDGHFLLTAILLETPSIWDSLGSLFKSGHDVKLKYDVLGGASIEQFTATVTSMMQGSHYNAIEAAYRFLGIEYSIQPQYISVQQVNPHNRGRYGLEPGDRIVAAVTAAGEKIEIGSVEQLAIWLREEAQNVQQFLQKKETLHEATVVIERKQNLFELMIDIAHLDMTLADDQLAAKALQVISFVEMRTIMPKDKRYKLDIVTNNIGGPSAGLAFALTIIDKLTDGNLTKGKSIAVTGTIDPTGKVGVIGGIKQKVHVSSENGADLFIVPKKNEKEARHALKSINSNMEIAAVSNLEEAIEILASLH